MKHIDNTLSLAQFYFTTYTSGEKIPENTLLDNRQDFLLEDDMAGFAVVMVLTNKRRLFNENARGLRSKIKITLSDTTCGKNVHSVITSVYIPRDLITTTVRADMPLHCDDLDASHEYRVTIHDMKTGLILGEKTAHFFDPKQCGKNPAYWFAASRGGISPYNDDELYQALDTDPMSYINVKFFLRAEFRETPPFMPALEIRVHFPDGSIDSRFVTPVCIDFDTWEYIAETPILTNYYNCGICYAELLCMDYPMAGFVFSTTGSQQPDYWHGVNLFCLEEYSIQAATERFRKSLDKAEPIPNDTPDNLSSDYFDRLLDEFIASEKGGNLPSEEDNEEQPTNEQLVNEPASMLAPLDHLTGLKAVKEKLTVYESIVRFNKIRMDNGLPSSTTPLHAMFLGSPGTGKTTVAQEMGKMLAKAGILSSGHVIVKERATLLGPNYSNEETNTLKAIEDAQGGILLIDEAYQLYQPNDPRDPGRFVIEALMTALADESRRDWMLILAGYPDEMMRMFDMNPGLRSRIPDSNIYTFNDFSAPELMEIAERYLERNSYTLSSDAREALTRRLDSDYSMRDKSFGNARHVINLIETEILPAMAVRVLSSGITLDQITLSEIQPYDIPSPTVTTRRNDRPRIGYRA